MMFEAFERAKRPIGIVTAAQATQRLQLQRLIDADAPTQGKIFASMEDAARWVRARTAAKPAR
jgi:hypothetical protein